MKNEIVKAEAVIVTDVAVSQSAVVISEATAIACQELVARARKYETISSIEDFDSADKLAGEIKKIEKAIDKNRKILTAPLEAFKKKIIAAAEGVLPSLNAARTRLGILIQAYQDEQTALRRKAIIEAEETVRQVALKAENERLEQERKKQEAEKERLRLLSVIATAKDFPENDAPDLVAAIDQTTKFLVSIPADESTKAKPLAVFIPPAIKSVNTKKVKRQVLHIFDRELIPRSYMIPDEVLIRRSLFDGLNVPGCEMVEETKVEGK